MGGISDGTFCEHNNTDTNWSEGQNLIRCLDCGDVYKDGRWESIPIMVVTLLAENKTKAAQNFYEYMNVAREGGIPYPDTSWEEYCCIATQILDSKRAMSKEQLD